MLLTTVSFSSFLKFFGHCLIGQHVLTYLFPFMLPLGQDGGLEIIVTFNFVQLESQLEATDLNTVFSYLVKMV
jgi:hypothetical protein